MRVRAVRMVGALFVAFCFALGLLAACGEPLATPEPVFLRAAGSTAMAGLVSELAERFSEQSPLVGVEVEGLGTRFGLDQLAAGRAEIALASWLPAGLDEQYQVTAVARDGIAIVVHPSNDVDGLGLIQLRDLFSGRIYEWPEVGGRLSQGSVQIVSREAGAGTRSAFETLVMEEREVTPLALVAPSSDAVIEYVATHRDAIGYVSMGKVSSAVKVLGIEGELPTPRGAELGSYPISRDLWLVTIKSSSDPVKAFLRFVQSPAGQQVIGQSFGRIR